MPWVIGGCSIFGTGALISDARVRFADGTSANLVQKIHPLSRQFAAGFSGSVRVGFRLIDSLTAAVAAPAAETTRARGLRAVATEWTSTARRVFNEAPEAEQRCGSQLLLVGASSVQRSGSAFSRIEVARLAAPEFVPHFSSGLSIRHLGPGAGVVAYKRSLRPLFGLAALIHQTQTGGLHAWARQLAFSVTVPAPDRPGHGSGEHLHVMGMSFGEMVLFANDMTTYKSDGNPVALKMPPVARSWDQFVLMSRAIETSVDAAIC
jgi:hypothetical protein